MTDQAVHAEAALAALDDTTLAVRDLISASEDLTARTARRLRMNATDMKAIMVLSSDGAMGVAELARRLGVSSAATSVLVDRLERAGHVERVRDTIDRRRVTVTETPAAREMVTQGWLPAIEAIDRVCRSLPDADRAVARHLLERLEVAMNRA